MQKQLMWKCLILLGLGILLAIPLNMIEQTILERGAFRDAAVQQVAANSASAQRVIGPMLVIPIAEEYDDEKTEGEGETRTVTTVRRKRDHQVILFPRKLSLDGALDVQKRAYGLHQVAVFGLKGALSGDFEPPAAADLPPRGLNSKMTIGKARVVVGLTDPRGIATRPVIRFGTAEIEAHIGTGLDGLKNGFQADVPFDVHEITTRVPFNIALDLVGTESFGMVPMADETRASLRSNWANPSFGGGFLPRERNVNKKGFQANWSVTSLAANVQRDIFHNDKKDSAAITPQQMNSFSVRLIDPVDIYHQAIRAAKYGILFIVLTFAAFFMFETVRGLPIHPVQYCLVGLALAVFFLLLLSLSEHINFGIAYGIAASACIGLITVYLGSVLRGWGRACGFGGGLGLLFAALFGVLLSEQNALLLGALLMFGVLATLMLATRRVNWYQLKPATA